MPHESNWAALFKEMKYVRWDVIGLSEFRTIEAYVALLVGHVLCHNGLADRKDNGVRFLTNENLSGNIEEFFSSSESSKNHNKTEQKVQTKGLQAYAPTYNCIDKKVEVLCGCGRNKEDAQNPFYISMGDFNSKWGNKNWPFRNRCGKEVRPRC